MADQKLSELSLATGVGPTDLLYVVQGGVSKKISVTSLAKTLNSSVLVLPVLPDTSTAVVTTGSTIINTSINRIQWWNGTSWTTIA